MVNYFVCGTFHHEEEEDEPCFSSPRKSRRNSKNANNNPYSNRGLDQFSALMDDLDKKRQKIYSQMRPQDISFIRFVSSKSNTNEFVPVIVKVKHNKDQKKQRNEELTRARHVSATAKEEHDQQKKQPIMAEKEKELNLKWDRPSLYLPIMVVFILVLLTLFGRSVATLCTCISWYVVSTLEDRSFSINSMKKKKYLRGFSEKKMATPSEDKSARKLGRQKTW